MLSQPRWEGTRSIHQTIYLSIARKNLCPGFASGTPVGPIVRPCRRAPAGGVPHWLVGVACGVVARPNLRGYLLWSCCGTLLSGCRCTVQSNRQLRLKEYTGCIVFRQLRTPPAPLQRVGLAQSVLSTVFQSTAGAGYSPSLGRSSSISAQPS